MVDPNVPHLDLLFRYVWQFWGESVLLPLIISALETEHERNLVAKIYRDYYPVMMYTAENILNNRIEAEDVVQDALLKIICMIDSVDFSSEERLKNFCCLITKHRAIDKMRSAAVKADECFEEACEYENSPDDDPSDLVVGNESYKVILKEISKLDDKYREVCILKYANGMKEREIAKALDLTENTVGVRIFRARQLLRMRLKKEGVYE